MEKIVLKFHKYQIFSAVVITFVACLVSLPLLQPGLYTIHDDQQISRLFLFDRALKAGQFPVRWVDELGFGFGYPLFIFYPPLVYFIGEFFHLLSFSFVDSIKLVFFLSILLSGFTMYFFVKEQVGKLEALVASLFYILTPYRAIDLYVRGALSEAFSFVWLPLILLCLFKLKKPTKRNVAFCGLSIGGLMVTHNLVFMPFMLVLVPYIVYLWFSTRLKKNFMKALTLTFVLGAGVSAVFWIPALWEKKYTIVDQILLVDLANYRIHFVALQQLWNWPWGYGGSAAGLNDGLSFKIGKINIVIAFVTLALAYFMRSKDPKNKLAILFFSLFILCAFMTTNYSLLIWEIITPLAYLQFPWRFLIMTTLFTAVLAGLFTYKIRLPTLKILVAFILVTLLLIVNLKLFKPQSYRFELTDLEATEKNTINWNVSSTSFEYAPHGVELTRNSLGVNQINISKQEIPQEKISLAEGEASIVETMNKPQIVKFNSISEKGAKIKANIFYFPGWNVFVDGKKVQIDDNNKFKQIEFYIPKGMHDVTIKFENTAVINTANLISFLSLGFLIYLIFIKWPKISF